MALHRGPALRLMARIICGRRVTNAAVNTWFCFHGRPTKWLDLDWTRSETKSRIDAVVARQKTVNIHEAKTHFSKLLKRVLKGEEVIIARAGRPIARLSALPKRGKRIPGSAKGMFTMTDDFDAPLPEDLQRAFEE